MGGYDLAIKGMIQILIVGISGLAVGAILLVLEKSCLHWMPKKLKTAQKYIWNRIFWCFFLRLII
jgi:hypothetical protein